MNIKIICFLITSMLALGACQQQKSIQTQSTNSSLQTSTITEQIYQTFNASENQSIITIQDINGMPLIGAQVLIGMRLNDPFVNNFLTTDLNGQIFTSQIWSDQPLTISYPGFVRVTYFDVNPGIHTYQLRTTNRSGKYELKGKTTGFGKLISDDNIADFGLIIQSMTRDDLFSFDLSMIISPEMDILSVAGYDTKIPSNVTFPKQVENYFIDLTLEKPTYRTYFKNTGVKKVYALHGKFPFSDMVDEFKNKTPFPALINYFDFVGASIRDVNVSGNQSMDIPVNEINFNDPIKIKTTPVANQKTLIALSANEFEGYIYPTDMKKVEGDSKNVSLKTANFGEKYLISALKRSEDFYTNTPKQFGISVTLLPILTKEVSQIPNLDLIPQPEANLIGWKEQLPRMSEGVDAIATYAALSHTQKFGTFVENKTKLWEAYSPRWMSEMSLPEWPEQPKKSLSSGVPEYNSWEVTYIGAAKKANSKNVAILGPNLSKQATHITYNRKDF